MKQFRRPREHRAAFQLTRLTAALGILSVTVGVVHAQTPDAQQQRQESKEEQRSQPRSEQQQGEESPARQQGQRSGAEQQAQDGSEESSAKAAEVVVTSPTPEVTIERGQPVVTVKQFPPRITVRQPAPQVTVVIPDAEVSVDQKQPEVRVIRAEPQVKVKTPGRDVVDANVSVAEGDAADVEVRFTQAGEPNIVMKQAKPEVTIKRSQDQQSHQQEVEREGQQSPQMGGDRPAVSDGSEGRSRSVGSRRDSDERSSGGGMSSSERQRQSSRSANAEDPDDGSRMSEELMNAKASEIVGKTLQTADNQPAGQVRDFVADMQTKEIFLVLGLAPQARGEPRIVILPLGDVMLKDGKMSTRKSSSALREARVYTESDYRSIELDRELAEYASIKKNTR